MSPGRNDPCPCGSGRKFKRCCQDAERPAPPAPGDPARLRERLFEELWTFAQRRLGGERLAAAAAAFGLSDDEDAQVELAQLFAPWLCFHWIPEFAPEEELPEGWEAGCTIAENYLQRHERRLSAAERAYVEAAVPEPLSAWRVTGVRDATLELEDLLRGISAEVVEPEAARVLEPGDLVLAAVVEHEGRSGFCGLGTQPLPPEAATRFEDFGARLSEAGGGMVDDLLAAHSLELIGLYREAGAGGHEPGALHHLRFEIESAHEAFERLRPLDLSATDEELRESLKLDEEGRVIEADLHWIEEGEDGEPIARLVLRGAQLDAVCDTPEKADRVRAELAERVGAREIDSSIVRLEDLA